MTTRSTALIRGLCRNEDGAVTVDWVVLTAALLGLGVALVVGLRDAATEPAESVGHQLSSYEIR
ncbi:hypothetical protein [Rubellimicrobium arenae]|uniref:hypothetical protein n=1 Tax=Rubellimicrobium arenae TaxID=2817372 RepID=UPI001B3006E6|nr:hypothetical protein [Rubellimicrobium arenae]